MREMSMARTFDLRDKLKETFLKTEISVQQSQTSKISPLFPFNIEYLHTDERVETNKQRQTNKSHSLITRTSNRISRSIWRGIDDAHNFQYSKIGRNLDEGNNGCEGHSMPIQCSTGQIFSSGFHTTR